MHTSLLAIFTARNTLVSRGGIHPNTCYRRVDGKIAFPASDDCHEMIGSPLDILSFLQESICGFVNFTCLFTAFEQIQIVSFTLQSFYFPQ